MTPKQLKALSHLPAVIDALSAMAAESQQLRSLMGAAGMATPQQPSNVVGVVPLAAPTQLPSLVPSTAVLDTPERREYIAMRDAELRRGIQPSTPPPAVLAKKRERSEYLRAMRSDGTKSELLAQFDANGSPVESVTQEAAVNMPRATQDPNRKNGHYDD